MKMRISPDTTQADQVLTDLIKKGEDLGPLMADISELLLHSTQDRFSSEQDPRAYPGSPWHHQR